MIWLDWSDSVIVQYCTNVLQVVTVEFRLKSTRFCRYVRKYGTRVGLNELRQPNWSSNSSTVQYYYVGSAIDEECRKEESYRWYFILLDNYYLRSWQLPRLFGHCSSQIRIRVIPNKSNQTREIRRCYIRQLWMWRLNTTFCSSFNGVFLFTIWDCN